MTELLENSDNTNADTGVSESPANEATISLAVAQSLADALQKIESYTPTVWVDNESPDIDAVHLNKAEQAIMRVTTAMNSAVDVIKDLQSQVNTTNNNLSKKMDTPVFGGVMEIGRFIDFHYQGSTTDYDGRLNLDDNGNFVTNKGVIAYKSDLEDKAFKAYYKNGDANVLASGIYLLENCANTPDTTTWWMIISFVQSSSKAGAQLAYGLINKNFKRRSFVAGKWDSWDDVVK